MGHLEPRNLSRRFALRELQKLLEFQTALGYPSNRLLLFYLVPLYPVTQLLVGLSGLAINSHKPWTPA